MSLPRVPMPDPFDKGEAKYIRDRLIQQYGAATVQQAEVSFVIQLMMLHGWVRPTEFAGEIERMCKSADERRRRQAGYET